MTQRHNTTLDTHTVATLKAYGGGNLSQGIRRAASLIQDLKNDSKTVDDKKSEIYNSGYRLEKFSQ